MGSNNNNQKVNHQAKKGGDGHQHGHSDHFASSGKYDYTPGQTHDFTAHADSMLGAKVLADGQSQYGGYAFIGENTIIARSPITGLQPVIEQAIRQIVGNKTVDQAAKALGGYDKLESKIANQLTNLNDWCQLQQETQNEIMIMTGINFDGMTRQEQEMTINHLQHSPLPFGKIEEVLSTNVKIDFGYTHTLDKNKTEVKDLGQGVWEITMISNNNNGSHTGHNMGSFRVDLGENADATIAKQVGNQMVVNTNDNNKLYLDPAARDVLYGKIEASDFDVNNPFQASDDTHDHGDNGNGGTGGNAKMYHDDPNAVQYVIGETANDVFMINGKSDSFQWEETEDGGYVVWTGDNTGGDNGNGDGHDHGDNGNGDDNTGGDNTGGNGGDDAGITKIADTAAVDYVEGTSAREAFVINGKSADYGWAETGDGGYVIWSGDKHDIIYDVEEIHFTDKKVVLDDATGDTGGNGGSTDAGDNTDPAINKITDTANKVEYIDGTAGKDAFVINGNGADYGWDKTEDGGVVVWSGEQHDILYGVEEIHFNDQQVSLSEYMA